MEEITNIINITSNPYLKMSPEGNFFKAWVEFLKPIHKLASREMDVLAAFLKERYNLSKVILDPNILDNALMSKNTKRQIREQCGISKGHFQVIMSKLKQNGVLVDNKICLKLVPSITENGAGLLVYFNFKQ